jgi:3-methylcrotonyl-CoA carboxylase beta subunit
MAVADKQNLEFNKNEDAMKLLVSQLKKKLDKIYEGGGKKATDKHKEKGKLTARERIAQLIDSDTEILEIGEFAGFEMYEEQGGCPAGGVIVALGYVSKRLCMIVANDATVKAGAWFPITAKKNLRAQEIAMENRLPTIYLVDSAGVFLPMQDEIFADKDHFGRMFRNNAHMSSEGIFQVAAVMGSCVAGGAYLPIMSDESLIVEKTGSIFLAGPYLVKAAIGEEVDQETLGGADTQSSISGVIDHKMKDDTACLQRIRQIIAGIAAQPLAGYDRIESKAPAKEVKDIVGIMAEGNSKPYDVHDIIDSIADADTWVPFKDTYGKSIVCGYARIDGWSVGIVANQRKIVKSAKNEMQIGGVIYSDSADKAARFIMNCNQKKIPLLFLQDVTGFMVGSRSEHGGIIKDGAKLVSAVSNSVVPKITIVIGNSYGAGNYAMCGKAYDPRFIYAWPTAKIAVMGGDQAAKTLLQIQVASQKAKGMEVTPEQEKELLDRIKERYDRTTSPYYAAARLWVDKIIDPATTRSVISKSIEAANYAPITKPFNAGVLQT